MRITDGIRNQIIRKAVEQYFPSDIRENFINNLKKVWCDYVYGLNPGIPEDRYIQVNLCLCNETEYMEITLYGCPYLNINQCVTPRSGHGNCCDVDIATCPVPHIREIVALYQDWTKKSNRFRLLLETELKSIYCDTSFVERLPYLKSALAPFMPEFDNDLAVAVDLEQIEEDNIQIAG